MKMEGKREMHTVWITGADRGIGYAMCEIFLKEGFHVFAGQFMPQWRQLEALSEGYPETLTCIPLDVGSTESVSRAAELTKEKTDRIDILVNCAGITGKPGRDGLRGTLNVNTLGALRMTETFLPLLEKGEKRLCFVSSEAGSITLQHREGDAAYCISKAALNMAVRLMFNELRGRGYTFRLYHPGWVRSYMMGKKSTQGNFEPEEAAAAAYAQFTQNREWEDVLVMTDIKGEAWPF